jgi:serine/threonine-protein kinase ULK2
VNLGIIHRDLKPANILNHDGIVKIADFGFAKYVDNYSSQLLRSCVGSPLYMAPQVLGRKQYTTKCDIWSIGVIFYEMLFHDVPWKGRDEQDLLKNIQVKPLNMNKPNISYSPFSEQFLKGALAIDE